MSHTVHPYAHRLGIIRDWKSRWFGVREQYRDFLKRDIMLREFLAKRLRGLFAGLVEIERGPKTIRVIIKTARPGLLIGRSGDGSVKLRAEILKEMNRLKLSFDKNFKLDIEEIKSPESNAAVVSQMIAESLEKRLPFRRVMKQTIEKVMANRDVKGVRLVLSGRLGGSDIARQEELKKGQVPLQTLRADIDFAKSTAMTTYGTVGIKVWIYKGEKFEENS